MNCVETVLMLNFVIEIYFICLKKKVFFYAPRCGCKTSTLRRASSRGERNGTRVHLALIVFFVFEHIFPPILNLLIYTYLDVDG